MRREKPLSVTVKAPTRGLISRLPGQTADYLPQSPGALLPGGAQKAASRASNVRYEDGVICNAPGYERVKLTATILVGLIAHWAMDEQSGNRVDATENGRDLTEVDGFDSLIESPVVVSFEVGKFNNGALFVSLSFAALAEDSSLLDLAFAGGGESPVRVYRQDSLFNDIGLGGGFMSPVASVVRDSLAPDSALDSGAYTLEITAIEMPEDKTLVDLALDSGAYVSVVISESAPEDKTLVDLALDSGSYINVVILGIAPQDKATVDLGLGSGAYVLTISMIETSEDAITLTSGMDSGNYS